MYVLSFIHYLESKVIPNQSNIPLWDFWKNPNTTTIEDLTTIQVTDKDGLQFFYLNSVLGRDNTIKIDFNNVSAINEHWMKGLPLKVTTHGWKGSEQKSTDNKEETVYDINMAYVDLGGFNIITVDWKGMADSPYGFPMSAALALAVGSAVAVFLENVVNQTGIAPSDIHLIGHNLGVHVVGRCGFRFQKGKIGRITGLDPNNIRHYLSTLDLKPLSANDAEFVDVIHTAGGNLGCMDSLGHADFFPNSGMYNQPGCSVTFDYPLASVDCSQKRAYQLYIDSVIHRNSLMGVSCSSWDDFTNDKCNNNFQMAMGHDASPR
ncbi:pancreatic triacylglycerol lipase-like [Melanaphis sacchari]|nr:pancreatic triacylglycerol lipase-like [Melanaphis sacchari]